MFALTYRAVCIDETSLILQDSFAHFKSARESVFRHKTAVLALPFKFWRLPSSLSKWLCDEVFCPLSSTDFIYRVFSTAEDVLNLCVEKSYPCSFTDGSVATQTFSLKQHSRMDGKGSRLYATCTFVS